MMAVRALGAAVAEGEPACTRLLLDGLVVKSHLLAVDIGDDLDLREENEAALVLERAHLLPALASNGRVRDRAGQTAVAIGAAAANVIHPRSLVRGQLALELDCNLLVVGARNVEVEHDAVVLEVELELVVDVPLVAVRVSLAKRPVVVHLVVDIGQKDSLRVRHIRARRRRLARVKAVAVPTLNVLRSIKTGEGANLDFGGGAHDDAREGGQDRSTHDGRQRFVTTGRLTV